MSAASLLSIVAPAPAPVAASKAAGAHGASGFDRMLGEAMQVDGEQARPAGKHDVSPGRKGAGAPGTASGPAPVPAEKASAETAPETTPPPDTLPTEATSPLPVAGDSKALDDAQVLPGVAGDKGADGPQILPGAPSVTVTAQGETPSEPPRTHGKSAAGPQVLPGPVDEDAAPQPVATSKETGVPQVLPGLSGKTGEPQVLPGPAGKNGGPQILPGVVSGQDKATDRQILPGTESGAGTAAAEPASPAATAAGNKAAVAAMAAMAPAVAPPPARPFADRTGAVSNSVRATGDRSSGSNAGAGAGPGSPSTGIVPSAASALLSSGATPTVPVATSLSDRPLAQPATVPTIPVADVPDVAVKSPVNQGPVEAQPAPVTQAGTTSPNYSLSNLSNAAVEVTAQLAAQIVRRMDARSTRFEMALTPHDLGRVDVSLDIDEHGRLAARLAFDNPAAALDMKGRVDDLRRQLEDAGFHLADDAFQFAERDRSSGEAFDRRQGRAFAAASRLSDETDAAAPVTAPRWMSLSLTPDRVDMKV